MSWYVYIVRCGDGSLYTGITKGGTPDCVARREAKHNSGRGAKYTRPKRRRPVCVVWHSNAMDHSSALKKEYAIKQLPKKEKEGMAQAA